MNTKLTCIGNIIIKENSIVKIFTKIAFALICTLILAPASFSLCEEDIGKWSREQFSSAFDEVARNYGAVEYATYTYMVEFGQAPSSLDALRESGHLNVIMTNPYTSGDVLSLVNEDFPDGDLVGNVLVTNNRNDGREAHLEAWFLRIDEDNVVERSMVKRIALYQSELDHALFFENELPRDEQLTAVYCAQAVDAIESFQQKMGESPENFDDMYARGDVNVHYINPITGELVESIEEMSPGDYYYEKLGEEDFILIGWGRERPVFFGTTSTEAEEQFALDWPGLFVDDSDAAQE